VGRLGDIACFSFNGNKVITTGGGGMLVTDNEAWATKARYLTTQAKDDPVEYIHNDIGYNYRLTNLQAAMGCAQLEQLDEYVAAKRRIAAAYTEQLRGLEGITPMREAPGAMSAFWLFAVLVDEGTCGFGSRKLMRHLAGQKIQTRPLWQPLHQSPAHGRCHTLGGAVAEHLHQTALCLPSSVGLRAEQQARVVTAIQSVLSDRCRAQ
jgi:dTDP-4-amino-4,6-dideoxygalactose transaminase